MFDFIIRGARLGDGKLADIAVQEGRIAALGQFPGNALREYPLNGRYLVSAGWIDCHVHCYPPSPVYHDEPDKVGVEQGVTTIIDAGSTGADNIGDFYQLTRTVRTCVYALLNIARCGIARQDELSALSLIDNTAVRRAIQDYPAFIVGLKARMSSSVVGDNGITPLLIARQMQQENPGLPLMVHLGNAPPGLDEITRQLRQGDIITHCFNGKPNQILTPDGGLKTSVSHALQRGVLLDVGHGSASFVFEVARTAIGRGILPDTISSDIYCQNRRQGPVRSLARVMSAFLHLGMTLSQVLDRVTCHPALALNLQGKGRLAPGADADLTIFDLSRDRQQFTDAEGNILDGEYLLRPLAAITGGHWCITDEGKKTMSSVYEKYGLKEVINASGRMTILGVSTPDDDVIRAVSDGLSHYFEMQALTENSGRYIAGLLGTEDAVVVSCAAAGITQAIAGVIVKDDPWLLENLHTAPLQVPHEIVIAKGHNVNFGAPVGTLVALGGGQLKEAGYANQCTPAQLAMAITPRTAAILYIKSHHCVQKSHLSIEQAVTVARQHHVPLIVDAAAEEDLQYYSHCGADLVIYSGAKAIEGPASGLVAGRQQPVRWVRQQSSGIGRAMKVGKESILGLSKAIERYLQRSRPAMADMEAKMAPFIRQLNTLSGVDASVVYDTAGRQIARTRIQFDETVTGQTAGQILQQLQEGDIAIYCRGYNASEGSIEVDVRSISTTQLTFIFQRITTILNGEKILCP